ncbi:MAG: tRNA (adenosine(37)-N6)-threonylcarbamoyltransferase complex dimerization subunit type 1 TsaB [Candidatus Omnitrophota bacterium]|nr:tRNA (adenosine(37)-N6)-threonylcarbamoyltransferase complex dimerization subunit type 1 TsaB [Candidatus Omnitrophota bacterium]
MKILGIDTSSKFLNIALAEDSDIIKEESFLLDRTHSSELVPKIKELLKRSRVLVKKIDAFVIGLGPGSFTGLRIGVSAVKGFGIATGKPCIGVASIDAIALNAVKDGVAIIPVIDAKREQVYAAIYCKKGGRLERKTEYLLLSVEKLMKKVKGRAVFLGDGLVLYKDKIKSLNKEAVFLEDKYWYPCAGNLIKLGLSKIKKAKKPDLAKLVPLYLYPEDCQVKKP